MPMSGGVAAIDENSAPADPPRFLDPNIDRSRVVVAAVVTLLISRLPEIVAREVLHLEVPWIAAAIVALTIVLWLAARVVPALRPLERFLAVMVAVNLLVAVVPWLLESSMWKSLVPDSTAPMAALLATRILLAVLGLLVLGWAVLLGASRREVYAVAGDLNAQTTTRRKDGTYLRWSRFGPVVMVFLILLMAWFGFPLLPASFDLAAAAPAIALGVIAALLNAWWEETAFRAAPLSMLQRAVGPGAGVLILALYFGVGHFYGGVPSGPMGLVATGAVAVLLGRAMIETRGLGWPIALHFSIDLVIFTFLAIASVA
ncbi:MAG: CPBP family intramembrane glutamic endopeptidase [Chloroflexota bacterium]